MKNAKLFPMEYRFMEILWESAPLSAGRLAMMAESKLNWKRTTSYTVLGRLIERSLVSKEGKLVTPLISKEEADGVELAELCDRCFGGNYDAMCEAVRKLADSANREKTD